MSWPSASISSGSASAFCRPGQYLYPDADAFDPFKVVCLLGMNDGLSAHATAAGL